MSEDSESSVAADAAETLPVASGELWDQVYFELRNLAAARLQKEPSGQTLQPTALVHEAWLRLVAGTSEQVWVNRSHFFGAAAEAMRRILVERARKKRGPQAGGRFRKFSFEELTGEQGFAVHPAQHDQLLAINEAMERLADESPVKAELVKLRFFAGLDHQEAAGLLGISRATADRYWAYSRAFLFDFLAAADP